MLQKKKVSAGRTYNSWDLSPINSRKGRLDHHEFGLFHLPDTGGIPDDETIMLLKAAWPSVLIIGGTKMKRIPSSRRFVDACDCGDTKLVLHPRDWRFHDHIGEASIRAVEHVPTKILFFPTCRVDDNFDLHFATTHEGSSPTSFDIAQRAQEAMRFFCIHLKTTPERETHNKEEWRQNLIKYSSVKTNGIAKITDEMREHVRDDFLLIFADDPADIAALEVDRKMTQAQQIDEFVEETCRSDELTPEQIKTPQDRKVNLRAAMLAGTR